MDNVKLMSLSKYLAHAGVGSRRAVVDLIEQKKVQVNGVIVTNPAHRIESEDIVVYDGKTITHEQKVYIMFNKPADCITTARDEHDRTTVLDYLSKQCNARVYPIGRLDRDTTGLLLLTNDGQLAHCLAHPRYEIKKTYHVTLDRIFTPAQERTLKKGIMLEDGLVVPDNVVIIEGSYRRVVSVTVHSGKYHVIRRLFEALGHTITNLDRAVYAGLTKQGLRPGSWRPLTHQEITRLKKLCNT
jgi:23S rRNA pseudouridine2605 synthase